MTRLRRLVIGVGAASVVVISLAAALFYHAAVRHGPLAEPTRVIVERGASLHRIAGQFEALGLVRNGFVFRATARLLGVDRNLRAGEYQVPEHAGVIEIIRILQSGRRILRRVTVPEGLTSAQIVAILHVTEGLTGEVSTVPPEGRLLPETYYFDYGDSRQSILERMMNAQDIVLERLWPKRAEGLPYLSAYEALILASIVEKETAVAQERALIASVFLNRLARKMRLQSDPTVIYGLTAGEPLGRPILRSELEADTAFNTYNIRGLPPQPIANPGFASIEAVLMPAAGEYLYFVADGKGGHRFSRTLAEHNKNVADWRRLRDE